MAYFYCYGGDEESFTGCRQPAAHVAALRSSAVTYSPVLCTASLTLTLFRVRLSFDLTYELQKPHPLGGAFAVHGGDEENRTPVRKHFRKSFSERS